MACYTHICWVNDSLEYVINQCLHGRSDKTLMQTARRKLLTSLPKNVVAYRVARHSGKATGKNSNGQYCAKEIRTIIPNANLIWICGARAGQNANDGYEYEIYNLVNN